MSTKPIPELEAFRQFVDEQLDNGGRDLSPEQALAMFRSESAHVHAA